MRKRLLSKIPGCHPDMNIKEVAEAADAILETEKSKAKKLKPEEYSYIKIAVERLRNLYTNECVLCGDIGVERLDMPYNSNMKAQWNL